MIYSLNGNMTLTYGRTEGLILSVNLCSKKLKKAGVNWLCLGIESANEKVRGSVNKK